VARNFHGFHSWYIKLLWIFWQKKLWRSYKLQLNFLIFGVAPDLWYCLQEYDVDYTLSHIPNFKWVWLMKEPSLLQRLTKQFLLPCNQILQPSFLMLKQSKPFVTVCSSFKSSASNNDSWNVKAYIQWLLFVL